MKVAAIDAATGIEVTVMGPFDALSRRSCRSWRWREAAQAAGIGEPLDIAAHRLIERYRLAVRPDMLVRAGIRTQSRSN